MATTTTVVSKALQETMARLDAARAKARAAEAVAAGAQFKKFSSALNLKPEWLGKTFEDRGHTYRIIGLARNPLNKNGVSVRQEDNGEAYYYPTDLIRALMSENPAAAKEKLKTQHDQAHLAEWKCNLERFGELFGYPKFGTTFQYKRNVYTVIGARERGSRKIATRCGSDDQFWFFTPEMANQYIANTAAKK